MSYTINDDGTVDHLPSNFGMGWHRDPAEVWRVARIIEDRGEQPIFANAAPDLLRGDDDAPVFFWEAEKLILGKILPSWSQGSVGTCVAFGCGRAVQDLVLWEIAAGEPEEWPGAEVATEPIYAGSRFEVGGGRLRGSDGSIGAWAAEWVRRWGILLRKQYGVFDLRNYSEQRARQWGDTGCPDVLEPEARKHPVGAVALVRTKQELWAAIGAGKPVSVASNQGFTTRLVDGFCSPSGQWMHQMVFRARFVSPKKGRSYVIQNSWGPYLSGTPQIEVEGRGIVELPQGCFAVTEDVAHRMVAQEDSWAYAGMQGWKRSKIDHTP